MPTGLIEPSDGFPQEEVLGGVTKVEEYFHWLGSGSTVDDIAGRDRHRSVGIQLL